MAWRVCKVPGCYKTKRIQPFSANTKHPWLCFTHRKELQQKRIDHLARVANVKLLTKLFTSR